ncbi:MAG: gas vesicle protein [Oscillochloris sp.]|nr:gas vesicle protein [Oscillochloris sp.]
MLDRILDKGVIIQGDLMISVADVDLVYVGLKVLLTSIERAEQMRNLQRGEDHE